MQFILSELERDALAQMTADDIRGPFDLLHSYGITSDELVRMVENKDKVIEAINILSLLPKILLIRWSGDYG